MSVAPAWRTGITRLMTTAPHRARPALLRRRDQRARPNGVPDSTSAVIPVRQAGRHHIHSRSTTPTGIRKPIYRFRADSTTPCASPTSFSKAVEADASGSHLAHQARKIAKTPEGAGNCGRRSASRPWPRRSRPAVPYDDQRTWHTCPASGSDHRVEPVLGIHVPRRHRLQSRLDESPRVPRRDHPASLMSRVMKHAIRLWGPCARDRRLMAQFRAVRLRSARMSSARLASAYANVGGLLMSSGIPYDFGCRPPALRRAHRASSPASPTHVGRDGEGARAFPGQEPRTHAAGHPQPPPRLTASARATRRLRPRRCRSTTSSARSRTSFARAKAALGPRARGSAARMVFGNAQVSVIAPTGTIGLLMDCDTTGIEPDFAAGQVQELAGRLLQRSSTARCRKRCACLATRRRNRRDRGLCGRPRLARPGARHQPHDPEGKRLHRRGDRDRREGAADRLRHQVSVQQWTLGEEFCVRRSALKQARSTIRGSICSRPSLHQARDRGRERAMSRRHDVRGCAAT